jgi:hypothetical protein
VKRRHDRHLADAAHAVRVAGVRHLDDHVSIIGTSSQVGMR